MKATRPPAVGDRVSDHGKTSSPTSRRVSFAGNDTPADRGERERERGRHRVAGLCLAVRWQPFLAADPGPARGSARPGDAKEPPPRHPNALEVHACPPAATSAPSADSPLAATRPATGTWPNATPPMPPSNEGRGADVAQRRRDRDPSRSLDRPVSWASLLRPVRRRLVGPPLRHSTAHQGALPQSDQAASQAHLRAGAAHGYHDCDGAPLARQHRQATADHRGQGLPATPGGTHDRHSRWSHRGEPVRDQGRRPRTCPRKKDPVA